MKLKKKESKKNKHRARLIVRNLPFDVTEENLREHFAKFGEIDEVKLLKKEDGKLLGCGFVQFKLKQKAAKARHHLNGKPFLNREIECDWALPKDKYDKEHNVVEPVKIKEEPTDDGYETRVKTEKDDETTNVSQDVEIKNENEDLIKSDQSEDEQAEESKRDEEVEEGNSDEEEMEDEEDIEEVEIDDEKDEIQKRKPHVVSNDATEGKTIFIKNVPFTATNDDVRSTFAQFGPLYYALVCVDPLTEHSKGTAFVKFRVSFVLFIFCSVPISI